MSTEANSQVSRCLFEQVYNKGQEDIYNNLINDLKPIDTI
jgi:hypothetical protein